MNILLADDHELILQGLEIKIAKNFPHASIFTCLNKNTLDQTLRNEAIDILLQDIKFGKEDARNFLAEIKKLYPKLKIIVLSSISDTHSIQNIINKKVEGYVLKSDSTDEIIEAIAAVTKGQKYLSSEVEVKISTSSLHQELILTRREKEILHVIMQEKSIKEIAQILSISEKTVEMHRSNLFLKLEVKNLTGLVKKVISLGLLEE